MKQITIYDLLPLLRKGWVAMDKDGMWKWHSRKPEQFNRMWWTPVSLCLDIAFNIKFDGDWKDSLMECGK